MSVEILHIQDWLKHREFQAKKTVIHKMGRTNTPWLNSAWILKSVFNFSDDQILGLIN